MHQEPIIMTVELEAAADLKATRAAIAELVRRTREEPGCVVFEVFESQETPGRFVLWEHFTGREALDRHLAADYTRSYFGDEWTRITRRLSLGRVEES